MEDYLKSLYKRHKRGAWVRSGASLSMWLFALISFFQGIIQPHHFIGITASVLLLVLMNPPTLWVLKKTTNTGWYSFFSLLINVLEIIGYTAIIYFLGGIEAIYIIPIYIILITYVGIVASRRLPFIVAGICSLCLTGILVLVHLGFLPQMNVISGFYIPWENQLTDLFVIVGFLFVSAFISSHIATINRRNREKLREQNVKLQETADELSIDIERRKREIEERLRVEEERGKMVRDLQKALSEVKTLKGIIPICASCKKIRDDKGYWKQVEAYIHDHSEAQFSHGICPDCKKKLYGDFFEEENISRKQ